MIEFSPIIIFQQLYLFYCLKALDKVLFSIPQKQDICKHIEKNITIFISKFDLGEQTLV